jgi:L-aspartate oxidase
MTARRPSRHPRQVLDVPALPTALQAGAPGWEVRADILVVGSGIAGLSAALAARSLGRVLLVTKTGLEDSATVWAQGGIAAALHPEDSPGDHEVDTVAAGAGLCDTQAVRALVCEGPDRVRELEALGARFEQTEHGHMALTREGGHGRDRIAHAGGDATGREISRALVQAVHSVRDDPGITIIEHAMVLDLLLSAGGDACGATLHVLGQGACDGVGAARARAVVLATGGYGQVYSSTTNPDVATGDGLAAAMRAGAGVTDLEFVQFHPTVLWLGAAAAGQQPLISEAVRGEGAVLRDHRGRRFMQGRHPLADLAPRDVVSQAVVQVMRETGQDHVYLDATAMSQDHLLRRFPTIMRRCRSLGVDPARELVPVAPAQHYASGGVWTDIDGRTTIPSLYACGEVSCTGVHGANRLASNSLLEGLVWAHRAVATIRRQGLGELREPTASSSQAGLVDAAARLEVQDAMTAGAGVSRDADGLAATSRRLADVGEAAAASSPAEANAAAWETTNLHSVGSIITALAQRRTESRGGHWRSDYPSRDDVHWRRRQLVTMTTNGSLTVADVPVDQQRRTQPADGPAVPVGPT